MNKKEKSDKANKDKKKKREFIDDGRTVADGTLKEVCADLTLEERFFRVYREVKGDVV